MSIIQAAVSSNVRRLSKISDWMRRYPLVAYFALAYALTWVLVIPILLSQRGLGIVNLPDPLLFALFLLSTFSGPLPAALILTSVIDGADGRRQLLRRMLQWRVGFGWYLLVFVGYPLIFLVGLSVYSGTTPWVVLFQKSSLIFTYYLPTALIGIIFPSLGEEPGWRGFALPRLQRQYGPLLGSLILGTLHGLWHLPAYFIPGAILEGSFNLTEFATNTCSIIAMTFIWTWLFNRGGGSVFFAMFVHGTSNAVSGLIPRFGLDPISDPWFGFKVAAISVLILAVLTRGRLGYPMSGEKADVHLQD